MVDERKFELKHKIDDRALVWYNRHMVNNRNNYIAKALSD